MKTITLRLDDELHKKFKMLMVQKEKTMQDRIIELIKNDLEQDGDDETELIEEEEI